MGLRRTLLVAVLAGLIGVPGISDAQELGNGAGEFKLTYYWIVFEKDFAGKPSVPLYDLKGKVLSVVSESFARQVSMEGTGIMRDGRILNLSEECMFAKYGWCFSEVNRSAAPFGYGSHAPLHPFRTIAVPDGQLGRGSVVYIPDFDGMPLPGDEGGFDFHDGCFVVEDTGWSLEGKHIDMFALSESYYRALHARVEETERVEVYLDSPLCPSSSKSLYNPESWAQEVLGVR